MSSGSEHSEWTQSWFPESSGAGRKWVLVNSLLGLYLPQLLLPLRVLRHLCAYQDTYYRTHTVKAPLFWRRRRKCEFSSILLRLFTWTLLLYHCFPNDSPGGWTGFSFTSLHKWFTAFRLKTCKLKGKQQQQQRILQEIASQKKGKWERLTPVSFWIFTFQCLFEVLPG